MRLRALTSGGGLAALAALLVAPADALADARIVQVGTAGRPPVAGAPPVLTVSGAGEAADAFFDVQAPPGATVRVELRLRWRGSARLVESATAVADGAGMAHVVWTGGRDGGDRTFAATACVDGQACTRQLAAIVHVRRLSVGIGSTVALASGTRVPLVVATEETALSAAVYADPRTPSSRPLVAPVAVDPAAPAFTVPALAPGLYRLVVRDADGNERELPLLVRSPLSLRHPKPGTVLVVLPYLTWRGYNEWDGDDDGRPDTWYAYSEEEADTLPWRVSLVGPYQNPRVPAGAERDLRNAAPLMPWLGERRRRLQVATDLEVSGLPAAALARYAGVLFPGHTEYVPARLFDLVRRYRDGGGRVVLLSANGFYRQVRARDGLVIADPRALRRAGRSDRRLLGSGYLTCCFAGRPGYAVEKGVVDRLPWLFRGTRLRAGDRIGAAAVEVDGVGRLTPKRTIVVASATVALQGGGTGRSTIAFLPAPRRRGGILTFGNVGFLQSTVDPALPAARRRAAHALLENAWRWLEQGRGAKVVR